MRSLRFLLSLILLSVLVHGFAQTKSYSIMSGKKKIGFVRTTKKSVDGKLMYLVSSKVTYQLMGEVRRKTFQKTTYSGDCVILSYAKLEVNDSLEEKNITRRKFDGYHFSTIKGESDSVVSECIDYSVANLYWEEPVGIEKVFSERFLESYKIQEVKDHVYKLSFGGIKNNFYHYEEGELKKIVVKRLGFGVEIIPKE